MQKYVALTFDDAVINQLTFVAPLLKEYGFGATFFICRSETWLSEHPECYMTWEDVRKLYDAGFEIGNHTLNHGSLTRESEEEGRKAVTELNEQLAAYGIPQPVSFAYPGGPYAENAAKWLGEYGLLCARTTAKTVWTGSTDPMNVASYSVNIKEEDNFQRALDDLAAADDSQPCAVVLTYHGVPDIAHPWCNTPPEMFIKHMNALRESVYPVISMGECRKLIQKG